MSRSFIASYKFFPIQKKSHQTIYFLTVEAMRHCTEGNMPQEIKFDQVTGIFAILHSAKKILYKQSLGLLTFPLA